MRIEDLSDSETARNTYDKDVGYFPQSPARKTTIPQSKIDGPKNALDKTTTKNRSSD